MQLIDVTCVVDEIVSNFKFQPLDTNKFTLIKQSLLINGLYLALFNKPINGLTVNLVFTHDDNTYLIEKTCINKNKIESNLLILINGKYSLVASGIDVDERLSSIVGSSINNLKYKFVCNDQLVALSDNFSYKYFDIFTPSDSESELFLEKDETAYELKKLTANPPKVVLQRDIDIINQEIVQLNEACKPVEIDEDAIALLFKQASYAEDIRHQLKINNNNVDIIAIKENLANINASLLTLNGQHQELIKQAAQLRFIVEKIEPNKSSTEEAKQKLEAKKASYSTQITALAEQKEEINKKIEQTNIMLNEAVSKLAAGESSIKPVKDMLVAAKIHVQIIEAEELFAKQQRQLKALNEQLTILEQKNIEKSRFSHQIIKLDNIVSPLKAKVGLVSVLDAKIKKLNHQLSAYDTKQENLERNLVELNNKLNQFKTVLRNIKSQIDQEHQLQLTNSSDITADKQSIRNEKISQLKESYDSTLTSYNETLLTIGKYTAILQEIMRYRSNITADIKNNNQERTSIISKYQQIVSMSSNEKNIQYFKALEENNSGKYMSDVISSSLNIQAQIFQLKQLIAQYGSNAAKTSAKIKQLKGDYKLIDSDNSFDSMMARNDNDIILRTETSKKLYQYSAEIKKLTAQKEDIDKMEVNLKQAKEEVNERIQQLDIKMSIQTQLTSQYDSDIHLCLETVNKQINELETEINQAMINKEKLGVSIALYENTSTLTSEQIHEYTDFLSKYDNDVKAVERSIVSKKNYSVTYPAIQEEIRLAEIKRNKLVEEMQTYTAFKSRLVPLIAKLEKIITKIKESKQANLSATDAVSNYANRINNALIHYLPQFEILFDDDLKIIDKSTNNQIKFNQLSRQQQVLMYVSCVVALDDNDFIVFNNEIDIDKQHLILLANNNSIHFPTSATSASQ